MKKCPFCAEEIQDEAVKCKHCGEFLDPKKKKTPWLFKTSTLVILFCFVGPFMIPLVVFNPHYSLKKKIIVTLIIAGLTFLIYQSLQSFLQEINKYYNVIFTGQL